MNQPAQQSNMRVAGSPITINRVFMFVAAILFVIAALIAGNVVGNGDYLPWVFGGFAAVALAWAL